MRFFLGSSIGLLVAITLSLGLCVLHPNVREALQSQLFRPYRMILSVTTGDLFRDGSDVQILKVRNQEGLFLEIYGLTDPAKPLLARLRLRDLQDGYFHFHGEASNLALHDVDGDQHIEIVAPTFDDNLIPHLNIFRYNPEKARLEPYTSKLN